MRTAYFAMMVSLLVAAAGCPETAQPSKPLKDTPWALGSAIIKPEDVDSMRRQASLRILDLRDRADYLAGHVPGAVHFEWARLIDAKTGLFRIPRPAEFERMMSDAGVANDTFVLFYDDHEHRRAAALWCLLDYYTPNGDKLAGVLNGGWPLWAKQKRPAETDVPRTAPAIFQSRVQEDRIIEAESIHMLWRIGRLKAVDTRPTKEFRGSTARRPAPVAGCLPGAVQLAENALRYPKYNTIEICSKVIEYFSMAGIENTHEETQPFTVIYGHDGAESAFAAFVARAAGIKNVRWYAGGWADWSTRFEFHPPLGEQAE
jgi:thiosulfate/3-mercaptopyruvate sulfurtransferase